MFFDSKFIGMARAIHYLKFSPSVFFRRGLKSCFVLSSRQDDHKFREYSEIGMHRIDGIRVLLGPILFSE